jgi:pimeloyl-ACP methyl ester carboxylesterase
MTLFFQEYGTGHPLIILHGLLGSLDNWHTLSTAFSKTFRVIAVDQRNHGRSPHSDEMTYGAMASDLLELFDQLGLASASILGHSMGGKTAMQFALSHPDRADRLVIADIAPRAYPPLHDDIFAALSSVDLASMQSRQLVDDALTGRIPDTAVRQFLMKNLSRDASGGFRWKANLRVLQSSYAELARAIDSEAPFRKPVLFVQSSRSGYVHESDTGDIHRLFPHAEFVNVDAGHWIHAEAPERFSEIVRNFLISGH